MKVQIIASTKSGHFLSRKQASILSGKAAGICYMQDKFDTLSSESELKTQKRAELVLNSGHHSVFDHPTYTLLLEDIPKILAMILNNEGAYTTSEKSARYTQMKVDGLEKELYDTWVKIFSWEIEKYTHKNGIKMKDIQIKKLAQENARYLISVFSPATTMAYTVSFRQLNYIISWFEDFVQHAEDNTFNSLLKPYLSYFINSVSCLTLPKLNSQTKGRSISLFDHRENRAEEFGENYSTTYVGSFALLAQAQRHRTLHYGMRFLTKPDFYVPEILRENPNLASHWKSDMEKLAHKFPQGMLIQINERGTAENFILKSTERLCGHAQLEIMRQTQGTLKKYLEMTKNSNPDVFNYLEPFSHGPRCTFPNWKCTSPCLWGKCALERLI